MSAKTVFISYRRDSTGRAFARSLKQELTHHGYDVFFDVDSIDAGKWAEQIRTQVPERSHFLLLLTPGALDRCGNQNDWVRQEFELAVQTKRNIVPVREESVDLAKLRESCPESMKELFAYQIATVESAAFERDVETLMERYIAPHRAPLEERSGECIVSPTHLHHGADHLFGRDDELAALDQIWNDPTKKVLTIVAFGGVGKTSLVIEWMARQAAKNWEGFERVFDWSFFSQGTREQGGASAEGFVAEALRFFGDEAMAQNAASAWDKGARLAQLVARQRTLLVLDGAEPLQHPPGPLAGELKDPALATLLKGLARSNSGLCIVTTRERVADLAPFRDTTAPEWQLHHLSVPAGVELLKALGVRGTAAEFQQLVEKVKGHALTLNLLGRYLAKAHAGDIRKSDQVKFEKADATTQGGYAFKTIGAYERWLNEGGKDGARQLAVLRLLGLFDRPADDGCMAALRSAPVIADLTEPLIALAEEDWNLAVSALEECGLISRAGQLETPNSKLENALDAHPLLREYFAKQLREKNPKAWRAAHRRLYEYLRDTTKEGDQPTLEDLQPLYQSVAHGCQAGLHREAYNSVFFLRIQKGNDAYPFTKLGAFGSELGAIACFFDEPWRHPASALPEKQQALVLSRAAFYLRSLGRLTEAIEPSRASLAMVVSKSNWKDAAVTAGILSEQEVALGDLVNGLADAEKSLTFAERSDDSHQRVIRRTTLANALHQAGRQAEADARFREAEQMQKEHQPAYALLYSLRGFQVCDLLLTEPERAAWQVTCSDDPRLPEGAVAHKAKLQTASEHAAQTLKWSEQASGASLVDIGLDRLTLGRAALYAAILEFHNQRPKSAQTSSSTPLGLSTEDWLDAATEIDAAASGLRSAGVQEFIVLALLTRAWLRRLTGPESAQSDLDEAWEIAERGPMRLFMADIHLYRARLFHGVKPYPWTSPQEDLAAAQKLIEQCGYWRRKEELEDAEEAAKNW